MKRGETVAEVASAVDVAQPQLTRVENGVSKASPALADRLARYFGEPLTRDQVLYPEYYVLPERKHAHSDQQLLQEAS
jgi:transcriptional regulator with XRE-family HTH domain